MTGGGNLNWIKFKEKHLFSLNFALLAAVILWQIRKDFLFHPVILLWFLAGRYFPPTVRAEKKIIETIGKTNGTILLTVFYFFFFVPFSFIYRAFFRHGSFRKQRSTFVFRNEISPFQRPF